MAIFNFRIRNPERDEATDARRFDRLARLLNELTDEISVEKSGLERRYRSATTDAAFLVEAIENDGVSDRSNDRVEDLTASIINCERRLEFLSRQASVLNEFRGTLTELARKAR
ncbi:hypothetical protein [Mesorhizobium sp. KR9-304]|uniref:hypothetical protein n=1 Tax=Mesorhizobium sp. KR9-304 TaxID=3156614 RepID=UPI0032B4A4A6